MGFATEITCEHCLCILECFALHDGFAQHLMEARFLNLNTKHLRCESLEISPERLAIRPPRQPRATSSIEHPHARCRHFLQDHRGMRGNYGNAIAINK